ncbi:MAG TPA: hypothetical protein VJJ98_12110 [Sedimentisphaerales bacterium]|nr:hypothetical protein [Sedimentisphaerales bacterium]
MIENKEQAHGQENAGDLQSCCEGGDCCPPVSGGPGGKWKMVVFLAIVVAAGGVLARSLITKSNAPSDRTQQSFAAIQPEEAPLPGTAIKGQTPATTKSSSESASAPSDTTEEDAPVKAAPALWGAELDSLASLNKMAANSDGVFILLAADDKQADQTITTQIEAAAKKIQAGGMRISAFKLKQGTENYAQVASQFSPPCVLAMVKGGGASGVSGEITETKLIQAFVAASRPSSGCGPAGCGPGSTTCSPSASK